RLRLGSARDRRPRSRRDRGSLRGGALRGRPPELHRRPHGEGQGRLLHGGQAALPLPRAARRGPRQGARRARRGVRGGARPVRTAFLDTLYELAKADKNVVFVTGDLGFSVVERFMAELPEQFVNAGVAEQNMTSLAAGMALMGKTVFTYSIANFPTLRCLEQVRNDVCYHEANVKVVAVGGGFTYGAMGASHHATEELGVMRMMPGMVVVAPADPVEARAATRALVAHRGPCYIRLGKAGE